MNINQNATDDIHPDDELEEPTRNINDIIQSEDDILEDNDEQYSDIECDIDDEELNLQNNVANNGDVLERDDFDEFITYSDPPDTNENNFDHDPIPTTDTGEYPFEIEEEVHSDRVHVSGHVILNQNGTILTRKKHQIKGSSIHKFFLQKMCSRQIGSSIPLLYPESMLFSSIFYHMTDDGAISGSIPSPLMTEFIDKFGFQSLPQHIRSRLTSASFATGTDPRYIAFSYDTMTNLTVNHEDTRIALHRGLTVDEESDTGLGGKGKKHGDSAILESIDSKQMVKIYHQLKNILVHLIFLSH